MTIKELRFEARLTQAELAEEIGVARITVTSWEDGIIPTQKNIRKLENYFGKKVNFSK